MSQDQCPEKLREGRKTLTLAEKVDVLRQLETGISHRKIAELFGVGRTQIGNISKRKKEILDIVEDYGQVIPGYRKRVKGGPTKFVDINELCYAWYKEARSSGIAVTGSLLQKKALEIAKTVKNETFKASNGWLDSFRIRHNISFGKFRNYSIEIPDTSHLRKRSEGNTCKSLSQNNSEQIDILKSSGVEMFICQLGKETMSDEVGNEGMIPSIEGRNEGSGDSSEMFPNIKQEPDGDYYESKVNQEVDGTSQSSQSEPVVTSYSFSGEVNHEEISQLKNKNKADNCIHSSEGRCTLNWRKNCLDKLKDALRNTVSELEDLGAEIAAWVVTPYDDKNSLITHMGSKHGKEFIRTKPDIDGELHIFFKKLKGQGSGSDCMVKKGSDSGLQEKSFEDLQHCQQSDLLLNEQDNYFPETMEMDSQHSYLSVTQQRERRNLKRKIDEIFVYNSPPSSSDDEASCESSESIQHTLIDTCIETKDTSEDSCRETKDALVDKCLKIISDKYASSTYKETAEFPYKLLKERGKPWFTLSGFPEDLLPFRHPSEYDVDSLRRILDRQDKIAFNILHKKLSEAYINKGPCDSKTKKLLQNRLFKGTSTKRTNDFSQEMDTFTENLEMSILRLVYDQQQNQGYTEYSRQNEELSSSSDSKNSFSPSFTSLRNPCIQTSKEKHSSTEFDKNTIDNFTSNDEPGSISVRTKEEPFDYEYSELHPSKRTKIESSSPCTIENYDEASESESYRTSENSNKEPLEQQNSKNNVNFSECEIKSTEKTKNSNVDKDKDSVFESTNEAEGTSLLPVHGADVVTTEHLDSGVIQNINQETNLADAPSLSNDSLIQIKIEPLDL